VSVGSLLMMRTNRPSMSTENDAAVAAAIEDDDAATWSRPRWLGKFIVMPSICLLPFPVTSSLRHRNPTMPPPTGSQMEEDAWKHLVADKDDLRAFFEDRSKLSLPGTRDCPMAVPTVGLCLLLRRTSRAPTNVNLATYGAAYSMWEHRTGTNGKELTFNGVRKAVQRALRDADRDRRYYGRADAAVQQAYLSRSIYSAPLPLSEEPKKKKKRRSSLSSCKQHFITCAVVSSLIPTHPNTVIQRRRSAAVAAAVAGRRSSTAALSPMAVMHQLAQEVQQEWM